MNIKHILLRLFSLMVLMLAPLWAQDAPSDETTPEPVYYTYHVPFPEKNFLNVAHFRLELISVSGEDFSATISGHKEKGQLAFREQAQTHPGSSLLTWDNLNKVLSALQSLEIVADKELTGVLWLWDDQLGFFNGVALTNQPSQSLVLPFVPSDYYTWQTRFAVKGLSSSGLVSNLVFGYHDGGSLYDESLAWSGLADRGYFLGAPFFNIPIGSLGDEPDVRWGAIHTTDEDFTITGYQSFLHQDWNTGVVQSCAIELQHEGSSKGWVGFSSVADYSFKDSFVFTNANRLDPVQVEMGLRLRVDAPTGEVDENDLPLYEKQVSVVTIKILLLPNQSITPNLVDLFGALEGEPVSLYYQATTVPVVVAEGEDQPVPEPRSIFAMHLQSDSTGAKLGGSNFVPLDGDRTSGWYSMNSPYASLYEIYNTTDRYQKLDVVILEANGERLAQISTFLAPWERSSEITSGTLRNKIIEALTLRAQDSETELVIDETASYRLNFSYETEGTFFAKLTGFQPNDFAIVNPTMIPPVPKEPEPEPEPEPVPTEETPNAELDPLAN